MSSIRVPTQDPAGIAQVLELQTVPPVTTTRWFPRHKAQVVAAVHAHLLSIEEACRLYALSLEEFLSWQLALKEKGLRGLCVSRRRRLRKLRSRRERRALQSGTHSRLAGSHG